MGAGKGAARETDPGGTVTKQPQRQHAGCAGDIISRMRRTRTQQAILAAITTTTLAVTLAACSSDSSDEPSTEPDTEAPAYEVITEDLPAGGVGEAELLIPDATVESAEAAIRAYADTIDGPDSATIQVVRSEDAAVIVCRADWPTLDETMNCPDPGGN